MGFLRYNPTISDPEGSFYGPVYFFALFAGFPHLVSRTQGRAATVITEAEAYLSPGLFITRSGELKHLRLGL